MHITTLLKCSERDVSACNSAAFASPSFAQESISLASPQQTGISLLCPSQIETQSNPASLSSLIQPSGPLIHFFIQGHLSFDRENIRIKFYNVCTASPVTSLRLLTSAWLTGWRPLMMLRPPDENIRREQQGWTEPEEERTAAADAACGDVCCCRAICDCLLCPPWWSRSW